MFATNNTSTPDVKSDTGVGTHCPCCWVIQMSMMRIEKNNALKQSKRFLPNCGL
jgi:bacterioferritin-associated ferredoxin